MKQVMVWGKTRQAWKCTRQAAADAFRWGWKAAGALAAAVAVVAVAIPVALWLQRPDGAAAHAREDEPVDPAASLVGSGDTINGEPVADSAVIARIERVAAGLPAHLLASHQPAAQVRYLARAFGADDDAAVSYGVFRMPAAALAFGCAMDVHLDGNCPPVEPAAGTSGFEAIPGMRCLPLRLALGAAAYEPDRCEPDG